MKSKTYHFKNGGELVDFGKTFMCNGVPTKIGMTMSSFSLPKSELKDVDFTKIIKSDINLEAKR